MMPLELAASLPPDDPLRQEVEEACAAAGGGLARRWLDCLQESERLRLELHRVAVPDRLSERLRQVPEHPRHRAWLLAAACLLLVFGVAGGVLLQGSVQMHKRLVSLGILAINTHINDRHVSVVEADPGRLSERLSSQVPYPVRIPSRLQGMRLRGGRRATLGACPAVYTLWSGGHGDTSVIQIRLADFSLDRLAPQEVDVRSAAFDPHPCHVRMWSEGEMGFLLVTDAHPQ